MAVDNRPLNILVAIVALTFVYLVYDYFAVDSAIPAPDAAGECSSDSDCPAIYCIRAPCPQSVCEEGRCVAELPPEEVPTDSGRVMVREGGGCKIGGCSGQLCHDASEGEVMSTCEWRESYACYHEFGVCERQEGGECGWTQTEGLAQCLMEKS